MLLLILLLAWPMTCSSKSIVLYLANIASESSNVELSRSLSSVNTVFFSRHRQYPIVVAYDYEDRHYLTPELKVNLTSSAKNSIAFESVSRFRHVAWPFSMYTDIYSEQNPYYSRLGYRHMCAYWSYSVFSQPFMHNVTSYLRLDTDTYLIDMPVDPFQILQNENIGYLSSIVLKESPVSTQGLWETFLRFALRENIHPWGLTPLSVSNVDEYTPEDIRKMPLRKAIDVLHKRGYNLDYVYNNWEVSRVDIWRSEIYDRLAKFIQKAGGIIIRRWGDAPIRTLALHLLHRESFRQYSGLNIYHKINIVTHGTEVYKG